MEKRFFYMFSLMFFLVNFISYSYSCTTTLDVSSSNYAVGAGGESYDCIYVRSGYTLSVDYPLGVTKEMVVYSGGIVTHSTNTNTKVNWMIITTVNLTVEIGGIITGNSKGYAGGAASTIGNGPGAGMRHGTGDAGGAGHGGSGANADAAGGIAYGSASAPVDLGSGGGGGQTGPGGSGGGAILLNISNTFNLDGSLYSNGAVGGTKFNDAGGGGSAGSIFIDTSVFLGTGIITANGGSGGSGTAGGGSGGRIAIYYDSNSFTGSASAHGGGGANYGGVGSVYFKPSSGLGTLYYRGNYDPASNIISSTLNSSLMPISNYNLVVDYTEITINSDVLMDGDVSIINSSRFFLRGDLYGKDMDLFGSSNIYVQNYLKSSYDVIELNFDNVNIDNLSFISASTYGYRGGATSTIGNGPGAGMRHGTGDGGGAGYGGSGANADAAGGIAYGSASAPIDLGSGGGGGQTGPGGSGGGAILLNISNTFNLDGSLYSNGAVGGTQFNDAGGGGSAGSIFIDTGIFSGSGIITAKGGNGGSGTAGGGSGGRIAVYYDTNSFTGFTSAYGGTGPNIGGIGSVYFKPSSGLGTLYYKGNYDPASNIVSSTLNSSLMPISNYNLVVDYAEVIANSDILMDGDVNIINSSRFFLSGNLYGKNMNVLTDADIYIRNYLKLSYDVIELDFDNVNIDNLSSISASTYGYRGGGSAGGIGNGPGAGLGSGSYDGGGAGYGGYGAAADVAGGGPYGSIFAPVDLGSGGGGAQYVSGGSGGGAILLNVSNILSLNGGLYSDGGAGTSDTNDAGGAGSGGSIFIDTGIFSGSGVVSSKGGNGGSGTAGGGSGGRVAIYYDSNSFTGSASAYGGTGINLGGIGSVYFKPSSGLGTLYYKGNYDPATNIVSSLLNSSLMPISNYNLVIDYAEVIINSDISIDGDVNIINSSRFFLRGDLSGKSLSVQSSGGLHAQNYLSPSYNFISLLFNDVDVDNLSFISASGYGYRGGGSAGKIGNGLGAGLGSGNKDGGGAGYGGAGANSDVGGGSAYGSISAPFISGSGGGGAQYVSGGSGGGAILLNVSTNFNLEGTISSNGGNGGSDTHDAGGAGSGGSLYIMSDTLSGSGVVSVNGGKGGSGTGGGGSGGRIAMHFNNNLFSGSYASAGGSGTGTGSSGTVFVCGTFSAFLGCSQINNISLSLDKDYSTVVNRSVSGIWNAGRLAWRDVVSEVMAYNISGLNPSTSYLVYGDGVNIYNVTSSGLGDLTLSPIDMVGGVDILVIEIAYDSSNYVIVTPASTTSSGSSAGNFIFPFYGLSSIFVSFGLIFGFLL